MFDQRGTVSSFHLVKHFDDCSCDVAWNNKQAGLVIKLGLRVLALGCFYSAPPLLTTEHCSFFLLFCFNLLALSLLRDASKQKQISISNRCCFTDLFTNLFKMLLKTFYQRMSYQEQGNKQRSAKQQASVSFLLLLPCWKKCKNKCKAVFREEKK